MRLDSEWGGWIPVHDKDVRWRSSRALVVKLVSIALLVVACKRDEAPAKTATVTLGQVIDRTGSIATPSWADSIRLAVGTANQALRKAGRTDVRFALVEANSGNAPDTARAGAIQTVRKQGAKAIITDSSQDDIAISMLAYDGDPAHQLDVPVVCMACTSAGINNPEAKDADLVKQAALRNGAGWNFRTTMSDAYQARMLARYFVAHGDITGDGKLKLALYASDDPYGHGFSDSLKSGVLKLAPEASVEQIFHDVKAIAAEYNWAADVARLVDRKNENTAQADGLPDAVVVISFPKFEINFTKAYIESNTKVRLFHTHNFRAIRVIEALGLAIENHEGSSQAVLGEGPSAIAFSEDLRALNGQVPAFRDATAYDAAMSLMLATLHALRQNRLQDAEQVTGAMIRDSMRAVQQRGGEPVYAGINGFARAAQAIAEDKAINYSGASGPVDYDEYGDVVAQLARFRVQSGTFVDVERFDCLRDRDCPHVPQAVSHVAR